MTVVERAALVRDSAAPYVLAVVGANVAATALGVLTSPAEGDLLAQYLVFLAGLVAAVVLWWRYRPAVRLPRVQAIALLLMVALWAAVLVRTLVSGDPVGPVSFSVVLLLAMLGIKPPDAAAARRIVDGVAWLLLAAAAFALVAEVVGWADSWYGRLAMEPGLSGFERDYYWLPLADVLGLEGRWAGPFVHPNHAGLLGGLLLVIGLSREGVRRGVLVLSGVLVLLLVQSRTAGVAAVGGVLCVAAAQWTWSGRDRVRLLWAAAVGAVLVALLTIPVLRGVSGSSEPGDYLASYGTAMGRSDVWRTYAQLWQESPLLGVPDSRIAEAARDGLLPTWAATAHNLLLDTLTRLGLLGGLLLVAVLAAVAVAAVGAARRGAAVSAGITGLVIVSGLTEALVFWDRLAIGTIALLLAWLGSFESAPRALSATGPPRP